MENIQISFSAIC